MNIRDRQDDLTVVFDKTWKANHNDDIKKAKEKEKKFMNKMFGNNRNDSMLNTNNNINTPDMKLNNMNNNINATVNGMRQNKVNNIMKKWK